jgi:hypothetical protein
MKRWSDEAMKRWSDEAMKRWSDEAMMQTKMYSLDILGIFKFTVLKCTVVWEAILRDHSQTVVGRRMSNKMCNVSQLLTTKGCCMYQYFSEDGTHQSDRHQNPNLLSYRTKNVHSICHHHNHNHHHIPHNLHFHFTVTLHDHFNPYVSSLNR